MQSTLEKERKYHECINEHLDFIYLPSQINILAFTSGIPKFLIWPSLSPERWNPKCYENMAIMAKIYKCPWIKKIESWVKFRMESNYYVWA